LSKIQRTLYRPIASIRFFVVSMGKEPARSAARPAGHGQEFVVQRGDSENVRISRSAARHLIGFRGQRPAFRDALNRTPKDLRLFGTT
jgi:hypothetical protein